jgi:hypothetical protein
MREQRLSARNREDSGRAIAIEEGIVAAVFDHASQHGWLEGLRSVDTNLLAGLRSLTRGLEVGIVTLLEWEQAVLRAFVCWREPAHRCRAAGL